MGGRERGVGNNPLFPTPYSTFPTPYYLLAMI